MNRRDNASTRAARLIAYRLVGLQVLLAIIIAFTWGVVGTWNAAYAVLWGGVAAVLPSFFYARRLFVTTSARDAKRIVLTLFIGEFAKLILSGVLLVMMILFLKVQLIPLIVGFIGAHFGFWLAPLFVNFDLKSK